MIAGVERRLDVRGMVWIPRCCVEVNHAIERTTAANPFVDRLAFLLLVRVVVTLSGVPLNVSSNGVSVAPMMRIPCK